MKRDQSNQKCGIQQCGTHSYVYLGQEMRTTNFRQKLHVKEPQVGTNSTALSTSLKQQTRDRTNLFSTIVDGSDIGMLHAATDERRRKHEGSREESSGAKNS